MTQSVQLGAGTAGSQYTVSIGFTYPISNGTSTYSTSYNTSQTRFDLSSNSHTLFTGTRYVDIPFVTSLPANNYWVGIGRSQTNSTQATAAMTQLLVSDAIGAIQNNLSAMGPFGVATNSTNHAWIGLGAYSKAAVAPDATIGLSQISAGLTVPAIQFIRQA